MSKLMGWVAALGCLSIPALAQPSWQPAASPTGTRLELFRSIMTANYPTAETLARGDFHFEISHRFFPPIHEGYDANFGLDGPVSMRLSLGYGLTGRTMVTLGRSSLLDNLDLQVKHRLWERAAQPLPVALAINAGGAWSTQMPGLVARGKADADNFQAYLQLVANTRLLDDRVGLGLVPSYLYNSAIFAVKRQYTFTLGSYAEYRLSGAWTLWTEYSPTLAGYQGILLPGEAGRSYDSLGLGVSIETGGHFFDLFVTNNTRLNPALYLVGAADRIKLDNLRLAFLISRYL